MAEIVNLRRARKAKTRREKETEAEANRAKFGTPAAVRKLNEAREELAAKRIDAHRIETENEK
jgi:hypothetical protein